MTGNNELCKYSVLMPLWYKERLDFLKASLESMLNQTVSPSEIVMITDHDLPDDMKLLIQSLQEKYTDIPIYVIQNHILFGKGLGGILAFGVTQCHYPIVARMDTDDISFPNRCEKELEVLINNPRIAIVGGGLEKFSDTVENIEGYRIPPQEDKRIRQYLKYRNPFNHPTVMFRTSIVEEVGNYASLKECEDYELWYRILRMGYEGYNLQFPVLHYRAGVNMLKRRKNERFFRQSLELINMMYKDKYINMFEKLLATAMQYIRYYAPFQINRFIYKHVRT